jgi:hypothetical protein
MLIILTTIEELLKSLQVQLKILENKIQATNTDVKDFMGKELHKEIEEVKKKPDNKGDLELVVSSYS